VTVTDTNEVWIQADDPAQISGKMCLVSKSEEATVMNSANAQQIERRATDVYSHYRWERIPVDAADRFILKGIEK
jgi:hypothetical protein